MKAAGFVAESVPGAGFEGFERADLDTGRAAVPDAGDSSVDVYRREHVAVASDDMRPVLVGDDPASVAVGEKGAVPHAHQPWRGRVVVVGGIRRIWEIKQLVAIGGPIRDELVAHGLECGTSDRHCLQAELGEVGDRGRAEPGEITAYERPDGIVCRRASAPRRSFIVAVAIE